ncbi:MAG: YjbE family putative metal transport protein [Rubrivivax sp.]|nr:YjbE family putative metal transport protein [Rubrivivax sp.]
MDMLLTPDFWIAVGQIILIDILLGGDNAVVIALACRRLRPEQRTQGILWGTAGAIVLRIVLIFFALQLLAIPFLKIVGALLLIWIGVKLLLPEHDGGHDRIEGSDRLWGAVKTVIVADFVMSVDNVIAIAGAAETAGGGQHSMALVIFGVLVSIPIIVWGSQLVIKLMDRFPVIIIGGGMLLGWIAGSMIVTDPALANPDVMPQWPKLPPSDIVRYAAGVAGALLVLVLGKWLAARQAPALQPAEAPVPAPGSYQRVLVAVDGSACAAHAVAQALALRKALGKPSTMQVHLINVQRAVSANVVSFVGTETVEEFHQENSEDALAPARAQLQAADCSWTEHRRVGSPGPLIAEVAQAEGCDLIIMGTRGLGSASTALLGSVTQAVLEHTGLPVLLIK